MFCKPVVCAVSNCIVDFPIEVSAALVLCMVLTPAAAGEVIGGRFVADDTADKLRETVDCIGDDVIRLDIIDVK